MLGARVRGIVMLVVWIVLIPVRLVVYLHEGIRYAPPISEWIRTVYVNETLIFVTYVMLILGMYDEFMEECFGEES